MSNIRKFINLMEDALPHDGGQERDQEGRLLHPEVTYAATPEKVIATLRSYKSQSYTKLAQKIEEITALEEQATKLKAEIMQEGRESIADLFSADDACRTRVIDTVSFVMKITKDPKAAVTVQYAKVIDELATKLTPELTMVLESIVAKYSKQQAAKPAGLSWELKAKESTDLSEGAWDKVKEVLAKFKQSVFAWCEKYDKQLASLEAQVSIHETIGNLRTSKKSTWSIPETSSPWAKFAANASIKEDEDDSDEDDGGDMVIDEDNYDPYNKVGKDFQKQKEQSPMDGPAIISKWKTKEDSFVYVMRQTAGGVKFVMVDGKGKTIPWHREPKSYSDAVRMLTTDYEYTQVRNDQELSLAPVSETKNHMGETEYNTYGGWRRACRQANSKVTFDGDVDISQALVDGKSIGEWDGSVGCIYKTDVVETKNHMGETEYNTYGGWRRACRKANAAVTFDGDIDIAQALVDGKSIGEWDGSVGCVYNPTSNESQDLTEETDDSYPVVETLSDQELETYINNWNIFGKYADADTESGQSFIKFGNELEQEQAKRQQQGDSLASTDQQ